MYMGPGLAATQALVWDGNVWAPATIAAGGGTGALAPSIPVNKRVQWRNILSNNAGAVNVISMQYASVIGSADNPAYTKTDTYLGLPWTGFKTTGAVAGTNLLFINNIADGSNTFLGNTAGIGGFYGKWRLGTSAGSQVWVSTQGIFSGWRAATTNPAGGTSPSAFVDCVGVGHDPGDTNLQVMCNDSAGACTKTDLGSNFALATKNAYDVEFYAATNSSTITYKITNVLTGNIATGTLSTNTPTANTGMTHVAYGTNGVTAVAIGFSVGSIYIEQG